MNPNFKVGDVVVPSPELLAHGFSYPGRYYVVAITKRGDLRIQKAGLKKSSVTTYSPKFWEVERAS